MPDVYREPGESRQSAYRRLLKEAITAGNAAAQACPVPGPVQHGAVWVKIKGRSPFGRYARENHPDICQQSRRTGVHITAEYPDIRQARAFAVAVCGVLVEAGVDAVIGETVIAEPGRG